MLSIFFTSVKLFKLTIIKKVAIYPSEYNTKPNSGDIMNFIAKGTFKAGEKWQRFTKSIISNNKNTALEKIYSLIGSEHGLKRNRIRVDSVEEVAE